ncbi:V-type proton ATPase subunit S1-like [Daphnia pulex]|uniref:V-type proton ATPase subunit S1-like n=1 Tax=Daphnia pulex TaxID=6669 RepID=UPI001EDD8D24|nr:V-type proton ATPase subunit S1-like [Daphnia pulex]
MIPLTGIISLVIFTLFSSASCFENNVPVYMWNIDTDAVVNPLHSLNAEELVGKVSLSLERKLIALFMQDELSVEDFKSNDLVALKSLAEMDNDGTFYAPSVTKTNKLPEVLAAAGYGVVHVKSHQDLPASPLPGKTVLVVDLPATQLGDTRKENLQLNSNAISEVYETLKSQQPDVIGIFTAKKNSQLQMEESRRRITRNAPEKSGHVKEDAYADKFFNITQDTGKLFLFFEKAPVLKIKDEKKNEWANFTLNVDPDTTGTFVNETGHTGKLVLTYKGLSPSGPANETGKLNKASITFHFSTKRGYWYVKETAIDFDVKINDATFVENNLILVTTDISTPLRRSWHCSPASRLASYGFTYNGTVMNYTNKVILNTDGFQLQPFKVSNDKFGDGYDCVGFFTEGIWAAIILGLIIAMMLAWAISMVADIKTPDRYDDPKGKTITVTATD